MKISFLGPRGTFSEEALRKHPLSRTAEWVPCRTIAEVIMAAAQGLTDYALVPTENSIEGAINITLDMLVHKVDLRIQEELILPICHYLLARPGVKREEIEVIYSHLQPLAQCQHYLQKYFPQAEIRATDSTAAAVRLVAENDKNWAAIGTEAAQEIYQLAILADAIQDQEDNNTRFFLLAKKDHELTGRDKTSIAFALEKDRPGGLAAIMAEFAFPEINLTRIESRPSKKTLGEYIFFVDFIGHRKEAVIKETLLSLEEKTTFLKVLGSYPVYQATRLIVDVADFRFKKIAVLGLGLIGGSLALALKRRKIGQEVIGLDRRQQVINKALEIGAIDWGITDFAAGVADVDLLIMATPVGATVSVVRQLLPYCKKDCLITDVGSTKREIVAEIESFLPDDLHFVGGHPMTGSEKSGIGEADGTIFQDAVYVLIPTERTKEDHVLLLERMAEMIGCQVIKMSPAEHDFAVSSISHLPHLLAVAMVRLIGRLAAERPEISRLAAGGFRDTTRVASGDPTMWRDIFLANKTSLLQTLALFETVLAEAKQLIDQENNQEALLEMLAETKAIREQIPVCQKGMLSCK